MFKLRILHSFVCTTLITYIEYLYVSFIYLYSHISIDNIHLIRYSSSLRLLANTVTIIYIKYVLRLEILTSTMLTCNLTCSMSSSVLCNFSLKIQSCSLCKMFETVICSHTKITISIIIEDWQ